MSVTAEGRSRRWLLFALSALLLIGVAWIGFDIWAGRRVDRQIARLEQRFGSIDSRSVVSPPVAAEYNRARYVRAALAVILPSAYDKGVGDFRSAIARFEKLPPSSRVPEDLRAFVAANQESLRLADEARTRPQASWNADYAGATGLPSLLDVRALSQIIYIATLLDIESGKPDDASRRIESGLAVTASFENEPSLLAQLIRMAVGFQQCEAARRLLVNSEPSSAALQSLARALAENRATDPMQVGLRGELHYVHPELLTMERGLRGRVARPFVRLARDHYLREMEQLIDVQAGPRPRPAFPDRSHERWWDWRRISSVFITGLERAVETGDQFRGVLGATELGVALRRHRLDHGSYPGDLAALVPAYLARLPIDPVTGRPPAYARSGDGFTLTVAPVKKDAAANATLDWHVPR